MSKHATSTFDIDSWDEKPYDEQKGAKLARARVSKSFRGDIEGESITELLLAYVQGGWAAYAGFERFIGRVNGRTGSFVLHHSESGNREIAQQVAALSVVPNSGTGELRGLRGTANVVVGPDGGHTFVLDYRFE